MLKKHVIVQNFAIGLIQNTIGYIKFTTPYTSEEMELFNKTKIEYLVSCDNVYANNGNVNDMELEIPIVATLRTDGYVEVSTTNTTLNPNSTISILLYEADIPDL